MILSREALVFSIPGFSVISVLWSRLLKVRFLGDLGTREDLIKVRKGLMKGTLTARLSGAGASLPTGMPFWLPPFRKAIPTCPGFVLFALTVFRALFSYWVPVNDLCFLSPPWVVLCPIGLVALHRPGVKYTVSRGCSVKSNYFIMETQSRTASSAINLPEYRGWRLSGPWISVFFFCLNFCTTWYCMSLWGTVQYFSTCT